MLLDVGWLDYSQRAAFGFFFNWQKPSLRAPKSGAKVGSPPEKVGLENLTLFAQKNLRERKNWHGFPNSIQSERANI
jgi:hypothetical protein